jgi:hypothetical protein
MISFRIYIVLPQILSSRPRKRALKAINRDVIVTRFFGRRLLTGARGRSKSGVATINNTLIFPLGLPGYGPVGPVNLRVQTRIPMV